MPLIVDNAAGPRRSAHSREDISPAAHGRSTHTSKLQFTNAQIADYRLSCALMRHEALAINSIIQLLLLRGGFNDSGNNNGVEILNSLLTDWKKRIPDTNDSKSIDAAHNDKISELFTWATQQIDSRAQAYIQAIDDMLGTSTTDNAQAIRFGTRFITDLINTNNTEDLKFNVTGNPQRINPNDALKKMHSFWNTYTESQKPVRCTLNHTTDFQSSHEVLIDPLMLLILANNMKQNSIDAARGERSAVPCLIRTEDEYRDSLGNGVKITFRDEGPGMPPELRDNNAAFNPGTSSKNDSDGNGGRGQGLYFVKKIIESAGGIVDPIRSVTLEEDRAGKSFTEFSFWLPAAA